MPEALWTTYRTGAHIPSLDGLVSPAAVDQIQRLQQALSSVAYIESPTSPFATPSPDADGHFVGRLLLGLLCRGWPSYSSPEIEQTLLESIDPAVGLTPRPVAGRGQIGWQFCDTLADATWDDAILGALLRGDRRLDIDEAILAMLVDSKAEKTFYRDYLVPLFGQAIGWLELQRPIASMIRQDVTDPEAFGSGRVDFALDLPGTAGPVRLVIELDGPHHNHPTNRKIDQNRDQLLKKHGWETRRVPVKTLEDGSLNHLPGMVKAVVSSNPFPFSHIEESDDFLASPKNREAVRLILTPHAVARMQLAMCRALMEGILDLSSPEWMIAVVEREVPCAELGMRDWLQMLTHLCRIYDIPISVKRVHLLVVEEHLTAFAAPKWKGPESVSPELTVEILDCGDTLRKLDLSIDVSVGAHPTRRYPSDPLRQPNLLINRQVELRTAQRQSGYFVDPWPEPRAIADPRGVEDDLRHFLRTLFRKETFWRGQMDIIERVLRREDVIGLLPTGAGKSITFQLPALLSPGLSLVIDPIKSLMQDQVENLASVGIMDSVQINSDTASKEKPLIEWQFSQGEFRLVFISPERLQVKDFRDRLASTTGKRPVSYVVIDEAHCVSEWGHDFRTAYLNLGRIVAHYCSPKGIRPPMVALTGTASESVLRDIQRELGVESENAIVRPHEFAREELKFEIVPVQKGKKPAALVELIKKSLPEKLGIQPEDLTSNAHGGIVFCPHVNGKLGVYHVAAVIKESLKQRGNGVHASTCPDQCPDQQLVGFYSGEPPKEIEMSEQVWAGCKARIQRAFKSGRMPVLVATSAFGMGIDKPNIRYTVHFAMAKSVEAFAQEAGRAGRDGKDAICAVLFSDRLRPSQDAESAPPLDCLQIEPRISVEEARARAAASKWASDDAEIQMFLHSRGYQGVLRESAAVRAFYQKWIQPHLTTPGQLTDVIVEEQQYRLVIEALIAPLMPNSLDGMPQPNDAPQDELPRPDLQRIIYRLSLLEIVRDYTVSYHPGNNIYSISVSAMDDQHLLDNLRRYVARYRTSEKVKAVERYFENSPLEDTASRCIDTLCWFIYEEIEQRRRQGIHNMRQMLRESKSGEDLARQINKTLNYTALTQLVFNVLRKDDFREWGSISQEILNAETAETVLLQCRRALEDAPDHPGLLLLLAISLLGTDDNRSEDATAHLKLGLQLARESFSRDDQQKIADWVVRELARIGPTGALAVLSKVVRQEPDPALAGAVLRSTASGVLERDSLLVRTCERRLLQTIDAHVTRFMSA